MKVGGKLVKSLRFADDKAFMTSTKERLLAMVNSLNDTGDKYDMRMNIIKTKVMKKTLKIFIRGVRLEKVDLFKYLGEMITKDAKYSKEIRIRIAMAKQAFIKHEKLLRSKKTNKKFEEKMIKSLVWSVLLYGSETWTLRKEDIKDFSVRNVDMEEM